MTTLQLFNYGTQEVRTVLIDGEPWFVAGDIARVLGYRMASDMTRRLDDDDKGTRSVRTLGGDQEMAVIAESGLYVAVLGSQIQGAKEFKRWVTREVLPAIRKTGAYGTPALDLNAIDPRTLALAILEESDRANAAEKQLAVAEARAAVDAPKVAYVEQFVAQDDRISFRALAGNLGIPETQLRTLLIVKNWIYCETEQRWSNTKGKLEIRNRYSAYSEKKPYFQNVLNHDAPRFKGGDVMHTLKITPAGAEAIARLIQKENAA